MAETLQYPGDDRDSSGLRRWIKWFVLLGAVVALVVVVLRVTREDAGDPLPPSHEPPTDTGGETQSPEQQAAFAECMREQGIDFRDEVGADGQVQMSPGSGVDTDGSAFQQALSTCQAEFGGAGGGRG